MLNAIKTALGLKPWSEPPQTTYWPPDRIVEAICDACGASVWDDPALDLRTADDGNSWHRCSTCHTWTCLGWIG